jgi:hemoglobin
MEETTLYERVGGQPFFDELVEYFYVGVEQEELIRPMYPEDLTESKQWLALFLAQYYGGPATYGELRGHPRLRMRHAPFRITKKARDAWLRAMTFALEQVADQLNDEDLFELNAYFEMAAKSLRNV